MATHAFSDLRRAAFCPRQLYYARRDDDRAPPPDVERRRALAYRYDELIDASDATLETLPLAVDPSTFRRTLQRARSRVEDWQDLVDPPRRDVLLTGRECRGVVHKCLADPPVPSLVSTGAPPEQGVWQPQSVHAVAAAKALAWERERPVERAYVEYPTHGVVRSVPIDGRRKARYRETIRTIESLGSPPPRLQDDSKCSACEYSDQCGVETRTLRSLLGFG
ncbi:Dna2/Cas4 domain-containing protein [Natronoarchaeum sp. GCM10025321]|uniref:CRISPR-associated protein Cas4 n=1 Tax=Natronoarchaeum sp. GCM10025321 TaxID=3252684 RepID=UPI003620F7B7